MIGKQVQQFRITQRLGQGGMGEVFLAEDTKLKRNVALKFLPAHYSQDPDFKSRFEHEATAAAALNHPNIVTVYELGEFEGKPFIAMEYIEGQSLDDLIAAGDVKLEKAMKIALQVLEGLSAAHAAGIVHRDIKPGNIIIDRSGRVAQIGVRSAMIGRWFFMGLGVASAIGTAVVFGVGGYLVILF